jgi:hypothetical protein
MLTALAGAILLLLLARLLAGLIALLLLTGLGLLAGLVALLLLTRILVGILVLTHSASFQRWSFVAPRPNVKTTRRRHHWFRMEPLRSRWNRLGTREFPQVSATTRLRDASWDAICCFGFWGFRCRSCF